VHPSLRHAPRAVPETKKSGPGPPTFDQEHIAVKDAKMLFLILLAMGALAAIWWFGWFGPVTDQFLEIKKYTTYR
jgi:hypothetical protein